jgi:hypothetical protein
MPNQACIAVPAWVKFRLGIAAPHDKPPRQLFQIV